MTVIGMRTVGIPLAVITAVAGTDMREMASTAQVTQPCQSPLLYIDTQAQISLNENGFAATSVTLHCM